VLIPTVVVGALGFWTSLQVIRDEKIRAVGSVPNAKKEMLVYRLNRQRERALELLAL